MRTKLAFTIIGASALATACGRAQANQPAHAEPTAAQQPGMRGGMAGMCPMQVEGTTVRAEDVDGGVALVFTTTGDVAELRRRVAHMAEMHERRHGEGKGGMMGAGMMAATARTEHVEGGAKLVLTADDPENVAALRQRLRQHAERMATGRCPMMMSVGVGDRGVGVGMLVAAAEQEGQAGIRWRRDCSEASR